MPRWTIADVMAAGDTIYANCSDPRCFASTRLDLQALGQRLLVSPGAPSPSKASLPVPSL